MHGNIWQWNGIGEGDVRGSVQSAGADNRIKDLRRLRVLSLLAKKWMFVLCSIF
jgi:hypothetical protein